MMPYSLTTLGVGKQTFYRQAAMPGAQTCAFAREVISSNATMPDALEEQEYHKDF